MNNYHYFEISKATPEKLFDPYYTKGVLVIPDEEFDENELTINNGKLIECISAFSFLHKKGYLFDDVPIREILNDIVSILTRTTHINYSAFVQFFMVHNTTYDYFKRLRAEEKLIFVYEMLIRFCEERHELYLKHGYTNSILQVLSDNYSHKRNSKTSIEKVLDILKPYSLTRISSIDEICRDDIYFLPDKGDKILFEKFLEKFDLQMESRKIEQNKYPDIVFQHKGHFYICELKMMKGSGGGQNKQIVEVAYFIKFSERNDKIHYLIMLDGDYSNALFYSSQDKIKAQRKDIVSALADNPGNYFVNTAGFIELTKNIFSE